MAEGAHLAVQSVALSAEVQRLRAELTWIDDSDLRSIEESNPGAAWALSLAFGGGGQIYNGDLGRGIALVGAWIGSIVLASVIFDGLLFGTLALMIGSSVHAFRQARAVNRYMIARAEEQRQSASHPSYQLLAAMAQPGGYGPPASGLNSAPAANTSAQPSDLPGEARLRLEKLVVLQASGVIDAAEHQERRIEILTELVHRHGDRIDDILFELLPLIQKGTLTRDDVDFIKRLGGRG